MEDTLDLIAKIGRVAALIYRFEKEKKYVI